MPYDDVGDQPTDVRDGPASLKRHNQLSLPLATHRLHFKMFLSLLHTP